MKIERITYFHHTAGDQAGTTAGLLSSLHQNAVDMETMWGYSASGNRGEFYLIPSNPSQLRTAAAKLGLKCEEGTCFKITTGDERGALDSTLNLIAQKGVSLTAIKATAVGGHVAAYLWCKLSDVDTLGSVLKA